MVSRAARRLARLPLSTEFYGARWSWKQKHKDAKRRGSGSYNRTSGSIREPRTPQGGAEDGPTSKVNRRERPRVESKKNKIKSLLLETATRKVEVDNQKDFEVWAGSRKRGTGNVMRGEISLFGRRSKLVGRDQKKEGVAGARQEKWPPSGERRRSYPTKGGEAGKKTGKGRDCGQGYHVLALGQRGTTDGSHEKDP